MRQAEKLAINNAIAESQGWPSARPMAAARIQSPSPTHLPLEMR